MNLRKLLRRDKILDKRLSDSGGKGLFSKNIEDELLKKVDIAVHALKDMPAFETDGLITRCFEKEWSREIFNQFKKSKFSELEKSNHWNFIF